MCGQQLSLADWEKLWSTARALIAANDRLAGGVANTRLPFLAAFSMHFCFPSKAGRKYFTS